MKKILIKYLLMYLPFIAGIVLFSSGVVNLFSSLLLFVGGYVAVKNTLDYRLVKKNINTVKHLDTIPKEIISLDNSLNRQNEKNERTVIKPMNENSEKIIGFKRTRRYTRVRKKY